MDEFIDIPGREGRGGGRGEDEGGLNSGQIQISWPYYEGQVHVLSEIDIKPTMSGGSQPAHTGGRTKRNPTPKIS